MKLLKFFESDLTVVKTKDEIERRIYTVYSNNERKARILYNFYTSIVLDGISNVKARTPSSTFYDNINLLKELNIDFNQRYKLVDESEIIDFNPFEWKEVV